MQMWLTSPKPRPKERVSLEGVPHEQRWDYACGRDLGVVTDWDSSDWQLNAGAGTRWAVG